MSIWNWFTGRGNQPAAQQPSPPQAPRPPQQAGQQQGSAQCPTCNGPAQVVEVTINGQTHRGTVCKKCNPEEVTITQSQSTVVVGVPIIGIGGFIIGGGGGCGC